MLVKLINPKEIAQFRQLFMKIDTNLSGTIEKEELMAACKANQALGFTEQEIENVIKEADLDGNGILNYHEFIAAVCPLEKFLTPERLNNLFAKFDIEDDKKITKTNLHDAFTKLSHNLTEEEIDTIMAEHDLDKNHEIGLEEFKEIVLGQAKLKISQK